MIMVLRRAFLVGAGYLSDDEMREGSEALARSLNWKLLEYSSKDNPRDVLSSLPKINCLIQLLGDAAMLHPEGESWLDSLGAFRQPIILKVVATPTGNVPGFAAAYTALCKCLCVPLLGLVQVGGKWTPGVRRLDSLPWLGYFPSRSQADSSILGSRNTCEDENFEEIAFLLQQRFDQLDI